MPIWDFRCSEGHITEHFFHTTASHMTGLMTCPKCHRQSSRIFTPANGRMLTYEESTGERIYNLETIHEGNIPNGPVYISSATQHKKAMRLAGVREPTASDYERFQHKKDSAHKKTGRWI